MQGGYNPAFMSIIILMNAEKTTSEVLNKIVLSISKQWGMLEEKAEAIESVMQQQNKVSILHEDFEASLTKNIKRKSELTMKNAVVEFSISRAKNNVIEAIRHKALLTVRYNKQNERNDHIDIPVERQLASIGENVNVQSIYLDKIQKKLIIITNEIETTYIDTENNEQTYNIGQFSIVFHRQTLPKIKNLTYTTLRQAHPCIQQGNGNVCIGEYDEVLRVNILNYRFDLYVEILLLFLNDLNSHNAYININSFIIQIENIKYNRTVPTDREFEILNNYTDEQNRRQRERRILEREDDRALNNYLEMVENNENINNSPVT